MERERFTIEVVDLPGWSSIPADVRLKRFLKSALRGYGLRCVTVTTAVESPPTSESVV
jgi:hypothetical protein